jgi:hypothetical protein
MYERIKELYTKALEYADSRVPPERRYNDIYYAIVSGKHAELIIKEYEKLLPEVCPWAESDQEGPMKGWHVQFVARKHFGVEE